MEKEEKNKPEVIDPSDDPINDASLEVESTKVEGEENKDDSDETKEPAEEHDPDALQGDPGKEKKEEKPERNLKQPLHERIFNRIRRINPYLLLFIAVILIAIVVVVVAQLTETQKDPNNVTFQGSELDQNTLDKLLSKENNIGTPDQTLTVAANAIFNGKVLVKSDLDVAGKITVGGPLSLPGITVSGTSAFEDVQIKTLSILGSVTIQQSLNVQDNANITGNVSVGGTISAAKISADVIEFTQGLSLSGHLITGGGAPSASSGTAVGSGGTVSISGNDTAGTVVVNTGSGPPAGILAYINFTKTYGTTPKVQITPVNSSTGALQYYVERSSGGFSIGTSNAPSGATTYVFDYFIVE
ncbi:hypothetical protein DYH10_03165 [Candidatus Saccharibacteria bacterium CPR2]|nr:hypothetical protein [Candidatus Saccharibacteria bacterium CPR2]